MRRVGIRVSVNPFKPTIDRPRWELTPGMFSGIMGLGGTRRKTRVGVLSWVTFMGGMGILATPAIAANPPCAQPLETLVPPLLNALPSYTNRVIQRTTSHPQPLATYILLAGNPDLTPLPLAQRQWTPTLPDTTRQVFFTTLERHYTDRRSFQTQNFYWGFFVLTPQGWRLALLYQQLGSFFDGPPSPRREASQGAIAQGIRLWLRDCQAGVQP